MDLSKSMIKKLMQFNIILMAKKISKFLESKFYLLLKNISFIQSDKLLVNGMLIQISEG
jgi:uncharacterized protein YfeS